MLPNAVMYGLNTLSNLIDSKQRIFQLLSNFLTNICIQQQNHFNYYFTVNFKF